VVVGRTMIACRKGKSATVSESRRSRSPMVSAPCDLNPFRPA
jgi:hypothetical protein